MLESVTLSSIAISTLKNSITKGSVSSVFGMITGMQLIVHTPLINIQFPANAFVVYKKMILISTYEFLPTQDIFPLFMDLPERDPFNEKFDRLDYGSFYSTMILGCVFLVFVW